MNIKMINKLNMTMLLLLSIFSVTADDLLIIDQATVFRPVKNKIAGPIQKVTDDASVIIDTPSQPTGVFYGVFYVTFKINKEQFFGDCIVDFYVKKGDDDWRKAAEFDPGKKPTSGDWEVKYLWNARQEAFDWNQTQPFKDTLKIKLKIRNI